MDKLVHLFVKILSFSQNPPKKDFSQETSLC